MNHIISNMNEIVVEIRQIMQSEIVINSPQMKQQLEDMQRNMNTMISAMSGFLGNFDQVCKHREQIYRDHPPSDTYVRFQKGDYDVA